MSGISNDEGMAYGFMMVCAYFIAAIMIIIAWQFVVNQVNTTIVNPAIDAGTVSVQTARATEWNTNMLRYAPVPVLLFGFIFAVNRGIFKRSTGG